MRQALAILTFICAVTNLFSQSTTIEQIEKDLHESYQKILFYRLGTDTIVWDSLEAENKNFRNKINLYTSNFPLTLNYSFDSLQKVIEIVTSDDKLFRIYSWNTWLGGTMYDFESAFQYKSADNVYSKIVFHTAGSEDSYGPFYSQIFTLQVNEKRYYLAVYNGVYSTKDASQSIRVFTIENDSLDDTVRLFKTREGLTNSINVNFDLFSVIDRAERPLHLIKYNSQNKTIYIPIVLEDGKVTDAFLLYRFSGQYFEYIGAQKKEKIIGKLRESER